MRRSVFLALSCLLLPSSVYAGCGDGVITGNILVQCRTFEQALAQLPCGLTDISDPNCGSSREGDNECWFDIGNLTATGRILFEWLKDAGTGAVPTHETCTRLKINVQQHFCGSGSIPYFRQCPDPLASDEDDDCPPFCGEGFQRPAPEIKSLWSEAEPCHAYALMPRGWQRNQRKIAATAFFTVGRHFPAEALNRQGPDESYSAARAFLENQLGITMLGAIGFSPLWGAPETGKLPNEPKLFADVGLCVDVFGALLASPYWSTPLAGVGHFPVLSTQCGLNLYTATPDASLASSPAAKDQVLPRLRRWAAKHQHDLVCVTEDIANERRAARRSVLRAKP